MHNQVICLCSAYNFPHRIGGGACNGTEWAEAYHLYMTIACSSCNYLTNNSCEVATGQESYIECEDYQDYLHTNSPIKLPINEDELLNQYEGR